MKQRDFEHLNGALWSRMEAFLKKFDKRAGVGTTEADAVLTPGDFPHAYRQVCHHLSLARSRQYTSHVVDRLDRLVTEGHQHLYQSRKFAWSAVLEFVGGGFPALVRTEARLVWTAFALFWVPAVVMGFAVQWAPHLVYTVLNHSALVSFESMYKPGVAHFGRARQADGDFLMFGIYISHNIGISFQTFAGGLLLGLGSIFYLIYNGVFAGALTGYLTHVGYGSTLYPFIIGHSALELTAMILAGAAGLKLGLAILFPGSFRRLDALRAAARISIRILYGVGMMLVAAAFLEAFWGSLVWVPQGVKFGVGALLWSCVGGYFMFVGRGHAT